jgi:hypothetical protein
VLLLPPQPASRAATVRTTSSFLFIMDSRQRLSGAAVV